MMNVVGIVYVLTPYFEEADIFIASIAERGGMKVRVAEEFFSEKVFWGRERPYRMLKNGFH